MPVDSGQGIKEEAAEEENSQIASAPSTGNMCVFKEAVLEKKIASGGKIFSEKRCCTSLSSLPFPPLLLPPLDTPPTTRRRLIVATPMESTTQSIQFLS